MEGSSLTIRVKIEIIKNDGWGITCIVHTQQDSYLS